MRVGQDVSKTAMGVPVLQQAAEVVEEARREAGRGWVVGVLRTRATRCVASTHTATADKPTDVGHDQQHGRAQRCRQQLGQQRPISHVHRDRPGGEGGVLGPREGGSTGRISCRVVNRRAGWANRFGLHGAESMQRVCSSACRKCGGTKESADGV